MLPNVDVPSDTSAKVGVDDVTKSAEFRLTVPLMEGTPTRTSQGELTRPG